MWQQGHGHNYKHDEYTEIDLFANCLLNTTKSYVLRLLTSSSARQKLCLPLWRLQSYYFSRHDPTQTLASVECLLLYDGDGPPRADSKVPPGASLQTGEPRLRSLLTYQTAAALPSASPTSSAASLTLYLRRFLSCYAHAHAQAQARNHMEPLRATVKKDRQACFKAKVLIRIMGFFVVAEKEACIFV